MKKQLIGVAVIVFSVVSMITGFTAFAAQKDAEGRVLRRMHSTRLSIRCLPVNWNQ